MIAVLRCLLESLHVQLAVVDMLPDIEDRGTFFCMGIGVARTLGPNLAVSVVLLGDVLSERCVCSNTASSPTWPDYFQEQVVSVYLSDVQACCAV